MKLFIALTFVLLRVLINTTATPCGGDPSPPIILPNVGIGLGLGSSQSSSFAGSQSASFANNLGYGLGLGTSYGASLAGSQSGSQAASTAQAISAAQAASSVYTASSTQATSTTNSVSSTQSNSLAISSAISQYLGIDGGGIGGILSIIGNASPGLLGNLNVILSSVLSSTQLITLISSLIGTANLNLQVLMNIIFESNGIGSVLGSILVLLSDILQPLKCGIVNSGPLQNLIVGLLGSSTTVTTVVNNIIGQIGLVLQILLGSVGGTEIILTQKLVLQLQELLTGANGIQVEVNAALANVQLFISETSSSLISLLQTLLATLGSGGGLQILINIMLNGILGAITQLIGVIPNTTICKLFSSILKLLLMLANEFGAIFIKFNNLISTCGCGCSKNLILALLILLRQLIGKVLVLIAAFSGFSGGFNIVSATAC